MLYEFRYIAKNFLACAHFHWLYLLAFNEIFLGWRMGEAKQFNPDCIFKTIFGVLWSFEESGRLGLHGHSPLHVSTFSADNLRKLFAKGEGMQQLLLQFAESLAMAYMPSAYQADEWRIHPHSNLSLQQQVFDIYNDDLP